jgi:hypothetical protein
MNLIKFAVVLFPILASSCGTFSEIQMFTFPQGSKSYELKWEYCGEIRMSVNHGAFSEISKKEIQIFIYNKNNDTLLFENRKKIKVGLIEPIINWENKDTIKIKWILSKYHNDNSLDTLNDLYIWDNNKKKYNGITIEMK